MGKIPADPYPELPLVLERFVACAQSALGDNFVGAYLVGSLATGDFDLDSDIDFLVVTHNELNDSEVCSLQALHREIYDLGCYPAQHLEGSYISCDVLNRKDLVAVQPLWYIDNGSTLLTRSDHDNRWHVRWILRERGITLQGPDAPLLVEPVSLQALREEILVSIENLRVLFLAEINKPLGYFNSRFGQSFTVLTCCRMLHTFKTGVVKSKRYAAHWAERLVDPEWHELIRQAWGERDGVRFSAKVCQLSDRELLQRTAQFIAYVQKQL